MDSIQEKVLETFKSYDKDGNGQIEREELLAVLQEINKEMFTVKQVEQMLESADMNKDGTISFDEFLEWIFKDELLVTHSSHHEDGVIVRKFVDGRTRTTFTDGAVIDEFKGGVRRQKNPNGTIVITDDVKGTKTTVRPSGTTITTMADGSKVQTDMQGRTITTAADGTRTQVDPDGVRVVTPPSGISLTHLLDGTIVERFVEEQSSKTGVVSVQRGGEGFLLIVYSDGARLQFEPATGIAVEVTGDGKNKLQRARNGSALLVKDGGKPEPMEEEDVLKAIKDGTYHVPEVPATAPVVEFSSLATAENAEEAKKITAAAAEKEDEAAAAAAKEIPMSPTARPRTADEAKLEPETELTGDMVEEVVLKSGVRRATHSDGRVVERHKDGTVISVELSGAKEQTDPDGTSITTYPDGRPTVQVNVDGTRIMTKADGSRCTHFPDGTVVEVGADKVKFQRSPDGVQIQTWPDGRVVQCSTDGVTIETMADGTVKQCRADGSGLFRSADKRTEHRHPAGYFKADIDGVVEVGGAPPAAA